MMKNPALFYGAIAIAVLGVLLGVYYLIPGIYHPLTLSGSPISAHYKHAAAFFGIAVICVIAALATRSKTKSNAV